MKSQKMYYTAIICFLVLLNVYAFVVGDFSGSQGDESNDLRNEATVETNSSARAETTITPLEPVKGIDVHNKSSVTRR